MASDDSNSAPPRFEFGAWVRVGRGAIDPDFPDIPLGGWSGTVEEAIGLDDLERDAMSQKNPPINRRRFLGAGVGLVALAIDGAPLATDPGRTGSFFGIRWGDTGSDVRGHVEYDYLDWEHDAATQHELYRVTPSDVIGSAQVVVTS